MRSLQGLGDIVSPNQGVGPMLPTGTASPPTWWQQLLIGGEKILGELVTPDGQVIPGSRASGSAPQATSFFAGIPTGYLVLGGAVLLAIFLRKR